MLANYREKPSSLQQLEIITQRMRPNDVRLAQLQQELNQQMKGFIGERKVDYFIDPLASRYTILKGLYLRSNDRNFQIDTLVLTTHAMYLIEIKNFNDSITLDTNLKQCFRQSHSKIEGFRYPITQAENQRINLQNWLIVRKLPNIPIVYFIAIADPKTVIHVIGDSEYIAKRVAHGEHIPSMILEKERQFSKKNQRQINHVKIGRTILNENTTQKYDVFKKYGIQSNHLLPGVICPMCNRLAMDRGYGIWFCPHCKGKSKLAHHRTINEHLILFNNGISNQECRHFLRINSLPLASRLLKSIGLIHNNRRWYPKDK